MNEWKHRERRIMTMTVMMVIGALRVVTWGEVELRKEEREYEMELQQVIERGVWGVTWG